MSNKPYGQNRQRRNERSIKAIGCIRRGTITVTTLLPR
jgi:hypothetical protein